MLFAEAPSYLVPSASLFVIREFFKISLNEEVEHQSKLSNLMQRRIQNLVKYLSHSAKMKFSIKDFFSKCDQIRSFLRIWSHLLKKSLMKNFIFLCSVAKICILHVWMGSEFAFVVFLLLNLDKDILKDHTHLN